jgi:hypothetical protein
MKLGLILTGSGVVIAAGVAWLCQPSAGLAAKSRPESGDTRLRVEPANFQVVQSDKRGRIESIQYLVWNDSESPVQLSVGGKTCGCVDVEVSPVVLKPGEPSSITLHVTVPKAGAVAGEVTVLGVPLPGNTNRLESSFDLQYQLHAIRPFGLEVTPDVIELESTHSESKRVITVTYVGPDIPSAFSCESIGTTLAFEFVQLTEIARDREGIFSASYQVLAKPSAFTATETSFSVSAHFEAGYIESTPVRVVKAP